MRHATTAARNVVSFSTLFGPLWILVARSNSTDPRARAQIQMDQSELTMKLRCEGRCRMPHHKRLSKDEEVNLKTNFSFFTSLSATEAQVFGVKFIWLYGTVIFIAILDFSFWGGSDLWSDVWPALYGVVCFYVNSFRRRSNGFKNFTKRRQNGLKIDTRDKFATHLR